MSAGIPEPTLNSITVRYPYVSHLICNAGVINFKNIDWVSCLTQLAREPVQAVTAPEYYRQYVGEKSVDGFGWVWQCNVFGHYCLVSYHSSTTFNSL